MNAIAELSIFPLDKGEHLSGYVSRAVKIISSSGLEYEINAMGTCFEGDVDEVMDIAKKCVRDLSADSDRIYLMLKLDCRSGPAGRMKKKIESVKKRMSAQNTGL